MGLCGTIIGRIREESGEFMENNTIKSVMFGGFDKQDVIEYIEKTAKESTEAQHTLQEENQELRAQLEALTRQNEELQARVDHLSEDRKQLELDLEQEKGTHEKLEPLRPEVDRLTAEVERLTAEVEALRPDAETYARFRERMGTIECESQKRAADLEDATADQMLKTLNQFRSEYQELMHVFETATAYVNGELRKVEVNLTQLPRAMDKTGAELNELAAMLEKIRSGEEE